ncbi:MAG: acyclic terpene utilization AtuA family protein, partial [Pseudomonadota bacterium]|nr:acyclic terpene utilization AtuA family protein [Pseudomonadota bacterium]
MPREQMHIGNAAGFSVDRMDVGGPVADSLIASGKPAALFYETLAERTLAIAQRERRANPEKGYTPDLAGFVGPVLKRCVENGVPIIGNFGAANPMGAAKRLHALAKTQGISGLRVAVVDGDDLRENIRGLQTQQWGEEEPLDLANTEILAANVYMGSQPIADALDQDPHVVVTGRVTDSALTLGPLRQHFGWAADDWDKMAAGVLAGHLLECGSQITGGYHADPGRKNVSGLAEVGFPIAEVEEDGSLVITKPVGSGGVVNTRTVKEQILYELDDPGNYLTPDVTLDITDVEVEQIGPDRVRVSGARGKPAPDTWKVTISVDGGWLGEGEISYAGPNALARAKLAAQTMRERIDVLGLDCDLRTDLIGTVSIHDGDTGELTQSYEGEPQEVRMRAAANAHDEATAALVAREVESLYCDGPAGGGGVRRSTTWRVKTGSVLVPRKDVQPRVTMVTE